MKTLNFKCFISKKTITVAILAQARFTKVDLSCKDDGPSTILSVEVPHLVLGISKASKASGTLSSAGVDWVPHCGGNQLPQCHEAPSCRVEGY